MDRNKMDDREVVLLCDSKARSRSAGAVGGGQGLIVDLDAKPLSELNGLGVQSEVPLCGLTFELSCPRRRAA